MKAATVTVCILCMAIAGPVPWTFLNRLPSPLNKQDAARPMQTQRSQQKAPTPETWQQQLFPSHCLKNTVKWRSRPRKHYYCRWLRLKWYFLAGPILAFRNTDELIGLTSMK